MKIENILIGYNHLLVSIQNELQQMIENHGISHVHIFMPTVWIMNGFPNSRPPCSLKPHGSPGFLCSTISLVILDVKKDTVSETIKFFLKSQDRENDGRHDFGNMCLRELRESSDWKKKSEFSEWA